MPLKLNEIIRSYEPLKKSAFKEFRKENYKQSLEDIYRAVGYVQQFNWIYSDEELEVLMGKISRLKLSGKANYLPNPDRVVLFDDWCTSYVLALQYIETLSLHFKEVLYVTGRDVSAMTYQNILGTISQYANVEVVVIPGNSDYFERSQLILDTITAFCPSKLFLHIGYNSPISLALYSIPSGIVRYLINLSDQTFWLGTKAIDYTLEFRTFGATVSLEKRGLKKEQILFLPFYPVRDGNPFQGFPEQTKGKVVIFSGGDFYKTLDPENSYWNLVRDVLFENPEAIFLYATKNVMGQTDEFLKNFITKNNLANRFIYIGFRPDIDEVFKHCDIFMGTCPVCGSLITQLAAINSKPILQYYLPNTYDDETEQALCFNSDIQISFNDKKAFMDEAKRLIQDKNYREQRGQLIYKAMFTREQFDAKFAEIMATNTALAPFKSIDYKVVAERWWWCELLSFYDTIQQLFVFFGKRTYLKMFPTIALKYYRNRLIAVLKRIKPKTKYEY